MTMNGDLISRQVAIEYLIDALYDLNGMGYVDNTFIEEELKKVPSVHAESKTVYWFDVGSLSCRCSECGCKNNKESNYCPECGAYMKGESNDETTSN